MSDPQKSRTTLVLPANIDRNATVMSAFLGISKNAYIEQLIEKDLKKRGIEDPSEPPSRWAKIETAATIA